MQQLGSDGGVSPERVILCGFSQGTMIAALAGLGCAPRVGAVVLLGSGVSRRVAALVQTFSGSKVALAAEVPVFVGHGMLDAVVERTSSLAETAQVASTHHSRVIHASSTHQYRAASRIITHHHVSSTRARHAHHLYVPMFHGCAAF